MRSLNNGACGVFRRLVEGLNQEDAYRKIDNTDGAFMPVNVDWLGRRNGGVRFSVAHNFIQNGDVMADPDMEFLLTDEGVYPLTYQLDSMGVYQDATGRPKLQSKLTTFANQWMRNIKAQQFPSR